MLECRLSIFQLDIVLDECAVAGHLVWVVFCPSIVFLAENSFPCFINRGKMACPVVHNDNQSLYLHEVTTVCLQVLKRMISKVH